MSHHWVVTDEMHVCVNCDTYRGSRASLGLCPAGPVAPEGQHCDGCGLPRDPFTGTLCHWCVNWMKEEAV